MANNSDYKKVRTRIDQLLPSPYQSETNTSLMENTINRFLTKKETVYVDGYIGKKNTSAIKSRQIIEDSIIAQANQLQPIVTATLGTEKRYMAWTDVINELEEQGVDMEQFSEWGATDQYNWVPPVDIDKLLHFGDYFWVDDNTSSSSEYITIRSILNEAKTKYRAQANRISRYGAEFPITGLHKSAPDQTFVIREISTSDYVKVTGDVTDIISVGDYITIKNTTNNNIQVQVVAPAPTYASAPNRTTVNVTANSITHNETIGQVTYSQYDGIEIADDYTLLFETGFKVHVANSTNAQLNALPINVVSSNFEDDTTLIYIDIPFTNSLMSGDMSLTEQLDILESTVMSESDDATATFVPTSERQWSDTNKWVHRADVENFASARQANYPIIEFARGIQLNEYIKITHSWKYRSGSSGTFTSTDVKPAIIELVKLQADSFANSNTTIVFDKHYGDLTNIFIPGYEFKDSNAVKLTTELSEFKFDSGTNEWNTIVTVSAPVDVSAPTTQYFQPSLTASGDTWIGYDKHWVYDGIAEELPGATPPRNIMADIPTNAVINTTNSDYNYREGAYAQEYEITASGTSNTTFMFANSNLRDKIIFGSGDLRVYLNGVRMYGGYSEILDSATGEFVAGIEMDSTSIVVENDKVLVEVTSPAMQDQGFTDVRVRTEADDVLYGQLTDKQVLTSLVEYRKSEQIKTERNQYPQFSLFNVDGSDASVAASIFEYKLDRTQSVSAELGMRVAYDSSTLSYTFTQSLIKDEYGLYAYFTTPTATFWVDTLTKSVYKNVDRSWSKRFRQGDVITTAKYSNLELFGTEGIVWFDTTTNTLFEHDGTSFVATADVIVTESNPSLDSIWKKSTNQYVPQKKDWNARTLEEYNAEKETYITTQSTTIAFNNPTFTDVEVSDIATTQWFTKESNKLSPTGEWIGDWTLPDYMYYNPENENKADVTTRELVGHLESIITAQHRIPGYTGDKRSQFHVFDQEDIDLGAGGKIRQYNNNFSTFLSSVLADNIIIPDLFEFAQNQYQITLDNARDIAQSAIATSLSEKPTSRDIQQTLIDATISKRSENNNLEFIYGDTTAYDHSTAVGVRNWIASLPSFGITTPVQPSVAIDTAINLYELVHHDGHRANYAMAQKEIDSAIDDIIEYYSNSTAHGITDITTPPKSFNDLYIAASGNTTGLTGGYYWIDTVARKVYIAYIDFIQAADIAVPSTIADTYWMNTTSTVAYADGLHYSDGSTWTLVPMTTTFDMFDGTSIETSNVTMWKEVDINEMVLRTLLDIETRLYASALTTPQNEFTVTSDLETFYLKYTKSSGELLPFVNTDFSIIDPFSWNYRNTVFGNNFNIESIDIQNNTFTISGNYAAVFPSGSIFRIKNSGDNDGRWTVTGTTIEDTLTQTTTITVVEDITSVSTGLLFDGTPPSVAGNTGAESASYWKALYLQLYGTPYPNLEPWKLQGYVDKPTWWDAEYKNDEPAVYGARRWKQLAGVGMWTQIIAGIVPNGETLPSGLSSNGTVGEVTQYDYVSVNVGDTTVSSDMISSYAPDDLYPPFFNHVDAGLALPNRSLFSNFNSEILGATDHYVFGENSQLEYEWRESSQFLYDYAVQAYIESPIQFVSKTFGHDTLTLGNLIVDRRTETVPSYKRTIFHGELNGSSIEKFNGINQWYINYNRYTNVDTNLSNFVQLWTTWTAPLSYRFNTFIDVRTLDIDNTQVAVEPNIDYSVYIKKTNGVKSFSITGLSTTLLSIPPKVINYDNSHLWKIQISNNSVRTNEVSYYGVRNYPFYADLTSNTMKIYTYKIIGTNEIRKTVDLDGDLTDIFYDGVVAKFSTTEEFTVVASIYSESSNTTTLYFNDSVATITTATVISADVNTLPWETGDSVWFTSERKLPAPLYGDTAPIGPIQYYIIKLSDTEFRVAETQRNAIAGLPVVLANGGSAIHYVGEIQNSFVVNNGVNTSVYWRHYKLDIRVTKTMNLPGTVSGVQQYINVIDGYIEKLGETGFSFDDNSHGWQSQIEKFIDYSFSVRSKIRNRGLGNRFSIKPNKDAGSWSWTEGFESSPVPTGYPVNIVANTGGLPAPFLTKLPYYLIINTDGTFNLASSAAKASAGTPIKLLDNGSLHDIEMFAAVDNVTQYPKIEVNMFKDRLSFRPPYGVVSDIITGPFSDITVANSLRDQYGNPMLLSDFVINRQDAQTDIFLTSIKRIDDTTQPDGINDLGSEGYHYISAATFYIDTYEHVVEFADYTNDDNLIYDGFVGLNLNRFAINFNRPSETSLRPNIGGSTILSDSKNLTTVDNIERMTDDLRTAYGAVANNESNRYSPYARKTLGYDDNSTEGYLTSLNINENSQFLFWQGLVQVKGSTRSIDSFINSKKFIDAQIDEFWAYQVADFGSVEDKEYPQMYINSSDIVNNTAKFEFIEAQETAKPGLDVSAYGIGGYDILTGALQTTIDSFNAIAVNDSVRWYRQPDQSQILDNNGLVMHFESRANNMLELNLSDYISDPTPTIEHNFKSDSIEVVVEFADRGVDAYYARQTAGTGTGFDVGGVEVTLQHEFIPFVNQISVFKNGVAMESPSDYAAINQTNVTIATSNKIRFTSPLEATDVVEVSYGSATLDSSIHYTIINSNIVQFTNNQLFQLADKITIWGLYSNFEAHNATKLIDVVDDSVVSTINLFDPARGMYNQQVFNDVDMITAIPPAFFNRTENYKVEVDSPDGHISKQEWASAEVGSIWVDTSQLAYVPYYDENIFTSVDERLDNWGTQADYSKLRVYEWVESDVHPSEYADYVESEQGNTSLPEFLQKSGTPKQTVFLIEYGAAPDYTIAYRELKDYLHEYSVLLDGVPTTNTDEYTFTLPVDLASRDHFNVGTFTVYVNGLYRATYLIETNPTEVVVNNIDIADYVQIGINYDVDDDELIEQAVEDLVIRLSYEYTEVVSYSDIGEEITTYYFWVADKLTRPLNNEVSAKEIENKWTSVTYPYLVLQSPQPAERVDSTIKENFDVDYSFTIGDEHLGDNVQYLQMQQTQADYSSGVYAGAGAYVPGEGYQPGDIVTLSNGAVVEIVSSDGTSAGEVTDFIVLYSGTTQPLPGDTITQDSVASVSSTNPTGFALLPSTHNFGGFMLRLSSAMESFEDGLDSVDSSEDTLIITINDVIVTEKDDDTSSGEYVVFNNKLILVGRTVELNDTVRVRYESNRPLRSDNLPHRYTQAIIRNIRSYINEDNRYTIRFRKDFTQDSDMELDNKTLHQEWNLFRQHQQSKIDRYLWDKVTESMIGYELDDETSLVPTIARRLYDAQYSDDTRIGLGKGQTFVSGTQALVTLQSDLNDAENEFRGIDVASFLELNSFDTPQNIIDSMEIIYTTFPTTDVNRIFFLFLNDALSGKMKYAKLLKTSMISVYGVKVLDTQEFFDE